MEPLQIDFSKNPKQGTFVVNKARYSCYSGGFGSGKTVAGCTRGLLLSALMPGNVGLVGRLTYPELRDTTRKTFFELCPSDYYDAARGGKWSPTENLLRLTNGSEIMFRHLDTVSEKELLSLNLGWFYIDQAEETSESVFQILQSRLRLNRVPNRFGFLTCNPEPGNWIYHKFKKPQEEGKMDPNFFLIDSSTLDNPFLPKDYVDSLLANYPEEMRKRYIEGRWDVMEDQIYKEFHREVHVVKPFTPPKGWEYIVSLDHGMVNPAAGLLGVIDYDGNLFIIDEYYAPGTVSEHVKGLMRMTENFEVSLWLIDPATQSKTIEKKDKYGDSFPWSIIEEYQDYNLFFVPANNEKLAGINRVKEFLNPIQHRRHPVTNSSPAPRLYIFQNCVNLLNEIVQYKWKKYRGLVARNAPEQSVDYMDHAVDSLRYMIMSRFPPPLKKPTGYELISREQRSNRNSMTKPMSKNYQGDDMLGMFYGDDQPASVINSDLEL